MKTMKTHPGVFVTDSNGKLITMLGDPADPWIATVTVKSGPGGKAVGNLTAKFVDGMALFDDLAIDKAGADYVLEFSVTYPTNTGMSPVSSLPFSVASRPLGLRIQENPPLRKMNSPFDLSATIWDEAVDIAAAAGVLATFTWECKILLLDANSTTANMTGPTSVSLATGKNSAVFTGLQINEEGEDFRLKLDCFSPEASVTVLATSEPFHVYEYPITGLVRKTETTIKFKGLFGQIEAVMEAFNQGMVSSFVCEGCPAPIAGDKKPGQRKRRGATQTDSQDTYADDDNGLGGDEEEGQGLIEGWEPSQYPSFLGGHPNYPH